MVCAISKGAYAQLSTLDFRWQKKFQDGFINLKDGSRLGSSKIDVTSSNIEAVAGLIKRDA